MKRLGGEQKLFIRESRLCDRPLDERPVQLEGSGGRRIMNTKYNVLAFTLWFLMIGIASVYPLSIASSRRACHACASWIRPCSAIATSIGKPTMEDIVGVCKRKGFVFQSAEIYSPLAGFFDYGPLGVELKNNLKRIWWKDFVHRREDIVGLDCSIISPQEVWQASGHLSGFSDPMVDCKGSNSRLRADQVYFAEVKSTCGKSIGYVTVLESANMEDVAKFQAAKLLKSLQLKLQLQPLVLQDLTSAPDDVYDQLPSPITGEKGQLTRPRDFNLMFQTNVGAAIDASSTAYLRPETAQGIFANFMTVQRSARAKIPFGIAQIGKAFRNEITPRNFIFRSREFEQMEIEYFIPPHEDVWRSQLDAWISTCWKWLVKVGVREEFMQKAVHADDKLAHYARACTDITFRFPFGQQELMGIAARGDFDLTQHSRGSGKSLSYLDPATNERYVPHVIEPSMGVERLMLAVLVSCYREEMVEGEKRVVFGFPHDVAPVKVSILPLLSNNPELVARAKAIYQTLRERYNVEYDSAGAIGRRYRRADESGTPFCVTIDFQTVQDNSVTIRWRDSMKQERLSIDGLVPFLSQEFDNL